MSFFSDFGNWLRGRLKISSGSKKAIEQDLGKIGITVTDGQIDAATNAVAGAVAKPVEGAIASAAGPVVSAVEGVADKIAPGLAPVINAGIQSVVDDAIPLDAPPADPNASN